MKNQIGVWQFMYEPRDVRDKKVHPAVFPIAMAKRVIEQFTHKRELVIDPFVSSSTTLVAAQETIKETVKQAIREEIDEHKEEFNGFTLPSVCSFLFKVSCSAYCQICAWRERDYHIPFCNKVIFFVASAKLYTIATILFTNIFYIVRIK